VRDKEPSVLDPKDHWHFDKKRMFADKSRDYPNSRP